MKTYADVNAKVRPKKLEVARLDIELNTVKKHLEEKVGELNKVKANVLKLRNETEIMV